MLNKLPLLLFFSLLGMVASGQLNFSGGLQAGLAATQVHGDAAQGFNKAGLSAAAFIRIDKGGPSAFQLEMGYIGKGSFKPADQENGDFDTWGFRFRYIQVPLLYVHSFSSFDLFAGPYGGYLISSRYQYNGNDLPIGNPEMQTFEIGAMFGAGMAISDHLGVTARYSQSVLPIRQSPQTSFANAVIREKMVNIVAEVLLSYRF